MKDYNKESNYMHTCDSEMFDKVCREVFKLVYEQAEKDLINHIRKQVETWMPGRDGDEHTEGKRLAFRSVLQLLKGLEDEQ